MSERATLAVLLRQLSDASRDAEVVETWLAHPSWITGPPPLELVQALADPTRSCDGPITKLARAWPAELMASALVEHLTVEPELMRRRRAAWTLKQVARIPVVPRLIAASLQTSEDPVVRRYLLEAVDYAGAAGQLHWPDIASGVRVMLRDRESTVRVGATRLLGIGSEDLPERKRLLIEMLADKDCDVIATAATELSALPFEPTDIPEPVWAQLVGHPNAMVRAAAQRLGAIG